MGIRNLDGFLVVSLRVFSFRNGKISAFFLDGPTTFESPYKIFL